MMRVAIILLTYSFFPAKLFESISSSSDIEVSWYVFFHGPDAALGNRIGHAVSDLGGKFWNYGENRGVAKSWNDGLHEAVSDGKTLLLLANDDLFFYDGGFRDHMEFAEAAFANGGLVAATHVFGLESGTSPFAGQTQQQGFACCVLHARTLERLGYFDQNFRPAYYEDTDYVRRIVLAGMTIEIDMRVLVEHERSKTSRDDDNLSRVLPAFYAENRDYFALKWGGDALETATFHKPFNRPEFELSIPYERRAAPYGSGFDRGSA